MLIATNKEQYSNLWMNESNHIESQGIYEELTKLIPHDGNVLEFGCGIGNATKWLLNGHDVLSLDSNEYLINQACNKLTGLGLKPNIHNCDFFSLSSDDKKIISDFSPKIIVGWFLGSCGEDIVNHTKEQPDPNEKGKLFREKIEDIIVSTDICLPSVEYIHLAARGTVVNSCTDEQLFDSQKEDYETYVFNQVGFEVIKVDKMPWVRDGSNFQYGQANNPNFAGGSATPSVISILAKRI
ncbi:TPA: class I SAM-dependent methyltransferase [Proteus mirabilis]